MRAEHDNPKLQPTTIEKVASTAKTITKIGSQTGIARRIRRLMAKIPDIEKRTRQTRAQLKKGIYPVVKTHNEEEAKRVFLGFIEESTGRTPFPITRQAASFLVDDPTNTDVLLARAIVNTHIFGLSVVETYEQFSDPKNNIYDQYWAIRLTTQKFRRPTRFIE